MVGFLDRSAIDLYLSDGIERDFIDRGVVHSYFNERGLEIDEDAIDLLEEITKKKLLLLLGVRP